MILEMHLLSNTIPGSGEGLSGIIDIDISSDGYGIPYIPAKRIKGILRESALELNDLGMLQYSVDDIFGASGQQEGTDFKISDGYIADYHSYRGFLEYTAHDKKLAPLFNKETILDEFTYLRSRTTIDNQTGTAKENTLRTSRVLKRGETFYFQVEFPGNYSEDMEKICKVTRRFGLSRTRGLGEIRLRLLNKSFCGGPGGGFLEKSPLVAEGIEPAQQCKLILAIKNHGQLMVTSKTGKKQVSETYIPGSALLGVFAHAYIKDHDLGEPHHDPMFRDIFLNGSVTFSNAYIEEEKLKGIVPMPVSFYKEKDRENYFDMSFAGDYREVIDNEIAAKALRQEFARIGPDNFTPYPGETRVEYHHSRPADKSIGHARENDGAFFQYSVLNEEKDFRAEIEGPYRLLEPIIELCKKCGVFYLGKSKTAQYGKCSIRLKELTEVKLSASQWKAGECIVVTLISDLVLRNRYGFVTPLPSLFIDEIAGILGISPEVLELERQMVSFTSKSGFSGIWKMPRIQENALKAGSVMVIRNNSGQNLELAKLSNHCFGIDIRDGCGKISINRHGKKSLRHEPYEPAAPNIPAGENLKKIPGLIERIHLKHMRSQLKAAALQKARHSLSPSGSFIGRMDMFIRAAGNFEELNTSYLSQLRQKSKNQLEKIERHLLIRDFTVKTEENGKEKPAKVKGVEIEKIKTFISQARDKSGLDNPALRHVFQLAGIDEHFFLAEKTVFDLYRYYAGQFLSTLRLVNRRNDGE
ncbi:MAG: RAMP superfamily CRISPR-associated protein [Candidatus Aminicenantes bacterium]|jgi:CRISPR-associated protein Csx10